MIIFRTQRSFTKNLIYYLSATKIQGDCIKWYDTEQSKVVWRGGVWYISNCRKLVTSQKQCLILFQLHLRLKLYTSIWEMSQNKMSISRHAYTRSGPTTKRNKNCCLVKLKGNWNKNSISVFSYKFQAYNKLSAAVIVYPLAPTLREKHQNISSLQHFFPRDICPLSCKNCS